MNALALRAPHSRGALLLVVSLAMWIACCAVSLAPTAMKSLAANTKPVAKKCSCAGGHCCCGNGVCHCGDAK